MFRRLSARLSRLISPFGRRENFRIVIESDEFPHYAGEVATGFLDSAPYSIEAQFDGPGDLGGRAHLPRHFSGRGGRRNGTNPPNAFAKECHPPPWAAKLLKRRPLSMPYQKCKATPG